MTQTRESIVNRFFEASGGKPVDLTLMANRAAVVRCTTLVREECEELDDAVRTLLTKVVNNRPLERWDIENLIKELADVQYVVSFFAVAFGIDLDDAFLRVHESNLTKFDDFGKPYETRSDGKVLKGPRYEAPDMNGVERHVGV